MAKQYELLDAAWDLIADIFSDLSGTGAHGQMIG